MLYCLDLLNRKRLDTKEVHIGDLLLGSTNPIRLQSMTTTDTMDTEKSVLQSIRMIDAGCELVRLTAPSKNEAINLGEIKKTLNERGYLTPLVADIHFTPNAAEIAAGLVEKVRVNPGNYADKKKFEEIDYTDESYEAELIRIEEKFTPLILLCKKHGTAIRIGTNHGSLSDRILSRYGDTPAGMVESAMEFIRICEKNDYDQLVISMKASNTLVMVQAYRLLVAEMLQRGVVYPLHLGVTEAGDGEDGRIKSAVGIGALLEDGIGDTIRVSLTEEPEFEVPVARKLAEKYQGQKNDLFLEKDISELPYNPFEYQRSDSFSVHNIGNHQVPVVLGDLSSRQEISPASLFGFGYVYSIPLDKWLNNYDKKAGFYPLLSTQELTKIDKHQKAFLLVNAEDEPLEIWKEYTQLVLVLQTQYSNKTQLYRYFRLNYAKKGFKNPIILREHSVEKDAETFQLSVSSDMGAAFIDGFGDGIWISGVQPNQLINSTSFGILQATRTRISKTEYISCPSCGRTLFDLQETTAKIREKTSHLKGLKIGIMGCIVNGPGEMADADYGYVGTGPGKINLYKEKTVVKRNIPEGDAVQALIDLIKEHGDWVETTI